MSLHTSDVTSVGQCGSQRSPRALALGILALVSALSLSACATAPAPGPETPVQGERPRGDEARVRPVPRGPDVLASQAPEVDGESWAQQAEGAIRRAELEEILAMGPGWVFTVVDLEPVREGGEFRGYQIVDVSRDVHERLVPLLRVGDVITHLNNVRLRSPDDYHTAWKTLRQASAVRVDFLREGQASRAIWSVR